ncbi:MAG TPA: FAD/NAD(P)-binding oxidoreductase [Candidatus Dormibacteraeota bacterium]|nr:FAD/NAD(P)-binding oxidoreductase [Candidatus Dormibacteraeota bacterium]
MTNDVLILGGGVGGTIVANLVAKEVGDRARITLVDATGKHLYQPGFLYVAIGRQDAAALKRPEAGLLRREVKLVVDTATWVDPSAKKVVLKSGRTLRYDELLLATGSRTVMEEVPGSGAAHDFYTLEGAEHLWRALQQFTAGTIVIGVAGIPYKCPPAPVEFAFLLDDYLRARGIRDKSEIKLLSPLNRAFTIEATSKLVQPILAERGIELTGFFNVESVDPFAQTVTSLEGETMHYDLLILVPPHRGQKVIEDSGLGDERGWVPVDKNTLRHVNHSDIWAIGDATSIPISKSGSVAHYEASVAAAEIAAAVKGQAPPSHVYDGKVMCFLETGQGQATTIRFDYDHPPISPTPSRLWHWAKVLFNKTYWHTVPQGRLP